LDVASGDAASRFGKSELSWTLTTHVGDFWLVDLWRVDGLSLRYMIAASNGAVRERRLRQ
jgi:hypothetical protein